MIQEVSDLYALLAAVHESIDNMVSELTDDQWLKRPLPNFNNVASVLDHVVRVEKKFLSSLEGAVIETQPGDPFKSEQWDLQVIRQAWAESLPYAKQVLSNLTEEELTEPGLKLGIGQLNKRQLISYAIAHATHHRGQLPLIKKLLG